MVAVPAVPALPALTAYVALATVPVTLPPVIEDNPAALPENAPAVRIPVVLSNSKFELPANVPLSLNCT